MATEKVCALLMLAGSATALVVSPQFHVSRVAHARAPQLAHMASVGLAAKPVADQSAAEISQTEDLVANANALFFAPRVRTPAETFSNVLSGFTVSLAMIPEAVAFAFVAGVSPIVGLQTTAVLGFFAAAFSGRGGIVTGASGACAVVMTALVASHGPVYLSAAVLLAGLIQMSFGFMDLGKFIRLVPHPVMLGFVNGLAVVMTRAQLTHFRAPLAAGLLSPQCLTMSALTALTMALVKLVPRLTKRVPPSLVAVGAVTALTSALKLPATRLVDIAGAEAFAGGLAVVPSFGLPAIGALTSNPLAALGVVAPYALTMATVGLVESLLTLQLVDGMVDDGRRGSTRAECIGQGLGNLFSGLTGGMGGCALIGQSLINVQSGGTSRLSGVTMAAFLALGLVCAAPLLANVPIAALVGVMLLVCQSTFAWSSLRLIGRVPSVDIFCVAIVSLVTVYRDLAQAVGVGTVVSALSFAWKQSTQIGASVSEGAEAAGPAGKPQTRGWRTYKLRGPLFFGSTQRFSSLFDPSSDPNDVVLDFMDSRVMDHSALEAINALAGKYGELNKRVHLRHLSSDCAGLLERLNGAMPPYEIIEADPATDPIYEVSESSALYERVAAPKLPSPFEYAPAKEAF